MTKRLQNFLAGAGYALRMTPEIPETPRFFQPHSSDGDALYKDWQNVGNDIKKAMDKAIDEQKVK